ncbi:MBL fold metallo-hydrolase [Tellurirhabdus rosea]|uniref:MBL fold metallo-hydrolase n=1 Tax=Tellurirhabdus rosea TaxID=2674997 RepID=UPI00224F0CEE|nr:MBL fold metallo-hydrolase [Tellurirhabdus rosea]
MKKFLKMMGLVLLITLGLMGLAVGIFMNVAPQMGGKATGARLQRIQNSPNFKDGTFRNTTETLMDMSVAKMARIGWLILRGVKGSEPDEVIKTVPFDAGRLVRTGSADEVAVSWFGHSSLLIRVGGKTILTDPVFGERASAVSFLGPKRFRYDRYMDVAGLPPVDAVIFSHDHYDHLDYPTVLGLKGRVKRFFVPLGVGAHLEAWGIPAGQITELDWWETTQLDELTLVCTPARHFSGRGFSRDATLWSSWVLLGGGKRVFYGADSGYSPNFKAIGDKYGPFDLAMLENGAYNEAWHSIHSMPEETAQAGKDVRAAVVLPIHWGKFNLALHEWRDPIRRLTKKAAELGLPLTTPQIGEVVRLDEPLPRAAWWDQYP